MPSETTRDEQTIRKLARSRQLPAFKVGKDWRFRRVSLLGWIERQQAASFSVLIIDDDEDFGRALSQAVEDLGCSASAVTAGAQGLELARRSPPDLVLLDLHMPGMNGPQVLEKLRELHAGLPVVIVTGNPDGKLMPQAMRFAPLLLLSKPVDPALPERTVRSIPDSPRVPAARAP